MTASAAGSRHSANRSLRQTIGGRGRKKVSRGTVTQPLRSPRKSPILDGRTGGRGSVTRGMKMRRAAVCRDAVRRRMWEDNSDKCTSGDSGVVSYHVGEKPSGLRGRRGGRGVGQVRRRNRRHHRMDDGAGATPPKETTPLFVLTLPDGTRVACFSRGEPRRIRVVGEEEPTGHATDRQGNELGVQPRLVHPHRLPRVAGRVQVTYPSTGFGGVGTRPAGMSPSVNR